jgi:ABC-type sugar transport system substrate-binding protein
MLLLVAAAAVAAAAVAAAAAAAATATASNLELCWIAYEDNLQIRQKISAGTMLARGAMASSIEQPHLHNSNSRAPTAADDLPAQQLCGIGCVLNQDISNPSFLSVTSLVPGVLASRNNSVQPQHSCFHPR